LPEKACSQNRAGTQLTDPARPAAASPLTSTAPIEQAMMRGPLTGRTRLV